jgi:nicotinamide riboside kinase
VAFNWDQLIGPAQAGLAARVVVLGAESTGTTTIAELLAAHYRQRGGAWAHTVCVPEAGRGYTADKWQQAHAAAVAADQREPPLEELVCTHADFDAVAAEQTRSEEAAAMAGSPLVVCDTDAFTTSVWERRYLGAAARGLHSQAALG